MFHVKKNPMF